MSARVYRAGSHYATITTTRFGYRAWFVQRARDHRGERDVPNRTVWRRSRKGIERAATRIIRRLDASVDGGKSWGFMP